MSNQSANSASPEKPAFSPGLAGVIAGESAICHVDEQAGLGYRGYDVHDLTEHTAYEQVAYLLIYGDLPNDAQLKGFRDSLVSEASLPGDVEKILRLLPKTMHPMDFMRTGISALAGFDPELNDASLEANRRKAVRILAKMNVLAAAGARVRKGEAILLPKPNLSHAANFLYMLSGEEPEAYKVKAIDILYILYAEHEFNASTFAARVTVSTLSDMYAGCCSALATLKGPLHGGANEEAMGVLEEIGSVEGVADWVKDKLAHRAKVMGFGHRVYKNGDSRVAPMRKVATEIENRLGEKKWVAICMELERVMEKEKKLFANADLYAAPIFNMLKIPVDLNTPMFAASRCAGWGAHVTEQLANNRIIRPRSLYSGPALRRV
ncbi:MAG TPA: citrate/2-methylcitrate synthase [Tepidisphaeraceae bacterium]|nr:citrate/2-methylcitrate synthase [Tepidisphaeraceae bacterium]